MFIDIHVKMKSGFAYPPKLQTYIVFYGVKELLPDVDSSVFDAKWYFENGQMTMNKNINMGDKKITGLTDGTDDFDAVNYKQLEQNINDLI